MNTSVELSELLRRGDIPRLLNQEFKERMPVKNPFEVQPQSFSSAASKIEKRLRPDIKPEVYDLNVSSSIDYVPPEGTNRGDICKGFCALMQVINVHRTKRINKAP
jgi:hypothetical protein